MYGIITHLINPSLGYCVKSYNLGMEYVVIHSIKKLKFGKRWYAQMVIWYLIVQLYAISLGSCFGQFVLSSIFLSIWIPKCYFILLFLNKRRILLEAVLLLIMMYATFLCFWLYVHKVICIDILTNFKGALIQDWLQQHGPFDAVVDGANVGLINQHKFSFFQVTRIFCFGWISERGIRNKKQAS